MRDNRPDQTWKTDDIYLLGDRVCCKVEPKMTDYPSVSLLEQTRALTWVSHYFSLPVNLCKSCFHSVIFAGFIKLKDSKE